MNDPTWLGAWYIAEDDGRFRLLSAHVEGKVFCSGLCANMECPRRVSVTRDFGGCSLVADDLTEDCGDYVPPLSIGAWLNLSYEDAVPHIEEAAAFQHYVSLESVYREYRGLAGVKFRGRP